MVPRWLSWLRPTRPLLVAAVAILTLRTLAWHCCGNLWTANPRDLTKGAAWDLALLFALAVGCRACAWAPRARWLPWTGLGVVVAALAVRWVDLAHCYATGAHLTSEAFLHLDAGFAGTLLDPRALAGLVGLGLSVALLAWSLHWDRQATARRPGLTARGWVTAMATALLPAAWAVADGIRYPADVDSARLVPEVNAARKWWATRGQTRLGPTPALPPETAERFATLGLVDRNADRAAWPLLRRTLEPTAIPYPSRPTADQRPNVVLTFLEGTNAFFLDAYADHYRGLMPELGALSRQMTTVRGLHNTSAPTISALITALCSIHPPSHPADWRAGKSADGQLAYTCLPEVLRQRGYRTVFAQGADKGVTGKEYFLRTHGFDEVIGRSEVAGAFPGADQGPWGMHDAELVTYTQHTIDRLERQRARDGRPYLLVMLTLDTHDPGMAADDCRLPPDLAGRFAAPAHQQLAAFHCSDKAVGRLGRFLLDPTRRDHTLWLVTADHAMFADLADASLYPAPHDRRHFTEVPLLLHDPLHALPPTLERLAGTRDLAPTLLHLLGIEPAAHSLTGHSLFGSSADFPFLVGRSGERLVFARDARHAVELPVGALHAACDQGQVLLPSVRTVRGEVDVTACDLRDWLRWQDGLWAAQRLLPAEHHHGAVGVVDREDLERRQQIGLH